MSLRFVIPALFAALCALPASAEVTKAQRAKVDALWLIAIDNWAPMFNCGATNHGSDKFLRAHWKPMREGAFDAMKKAGWSGAELTKLRQRTEIDALMLPPDTRFDAYLDYCQKHKDWAMRAVKADLFEIDREVKRALGMKHP
ncbi:hypothetical protein [Pseudogemmobacter bohemicus]|uniref:hypothetical protein n=1 Tax=Pseudogemmobacter bohemicus TaxID=2250708 RepID=UPI000DD4E50C|nr:hypothetical protein [Pseudogemmobacter bohemicus]